MPFEVESRHMGEVVVLTGKAFADHRGYFMETYRRDQFLKIGLPGCFVQQNHSCSKKGVVRGLHFQWDPPSTVDLAKQIVVLSRSENFGIYHATAEGSCSWYEFASKIVEIADVKTNLVVAGSNEFPAEVPRPKYSVLENHDQTG